MAKANVSSERIPARDRLLAAAGELFYEEGFNTVGIDRVIDRAGVAKASLYDCFGSKEELIRSYLSAKHEARKVRIGEGLKRFDTPRDRLLGVFDLLGKSIAEPGFRGCAIIKAGVEAKAGSSVKAVCDESRGWFHGLFADLAAQAGVADRERLAEQLSMLYDGASVAAQIDRNPKSAARAREAAAAMLDAALAASVVESPAKRRSVKRA